MCLSEHFWTHKHDLVCHMQQIFWHIEDCCSLRDGITCCMQSTIDMLNFWRDKKEAKRIGKTLRHPYNLGFKRNFEVLKLACTLLQPFV